MKRIYNILTGDLSSVRFFMSLLSLILSLGFFIASTESEKYQHINNFADKKIWGAIFALHSISLMLTVFYDFPIHLKRLLNLLGIWLWSYVFLSFTIYSPAPVTPTEWMLVMPVIFEFWLLTEKMFENKK